MPGIGAKGKGMRETYIAKIFVAGCSVCNDGEAQWFANNAQAVAAKHYDLTGHPTWVNLTLDFWYGPHESSGGKREVGDG